MMTHSFMAAPVDPHGAARPVPIYNHALLSIASENKLLMVSLASHGYVVVSIRHKDQRFECTALQNALSEAEKAGDRESFNKLGNEDLSRNERAALSLQVYRGGSAMPVIVRRRTGDTEYVFDNLISIFGAIPGCTDFTCVNKTKIELVGLSLGGAVATRFCKKDRPCAAVVNMDGGIFGTDIEAPPKVLYLMLYSERNDGGRCPQDGVGCNL